MDFENKEKSSVYTSILSDKQLKQWNEIDTQDLTDEIKLTTLLLMQALEHDRRAKPVEQDVQQQAFNFGGTIETVIEDLRKKNARTKISIKHDYGIQKQQKLISQLRLLKVAQSQIARNKIIDDDLFGQSKIIVTIPHNGRD